MTEHELILERVRDAIKTLPEKDQHEIAKIANVMRSLTKVFEPHGKMALALVGAEFSAIEE